MKCVKSFWIWRGTSISNLSGTTVSNSSSILEFSKNNPHICSISGKAEIPAKIASTSVDDMTEEAAARFFGVLSSSLLKITSSIKDETRF